jgi:hypothetical protein
MSKKLDLFFKSNVLVINPDLAKMIGLNEAIVLNQIYYWISVNKKQNRNFHDGKYWCYNSIREWQEENFPFWSYKTVERIFYSLRNKGLVLVGNYNNRRNGSTSTKWYTVNDEVLEEIIDQILDEPESDHTVRQDNFESDNLTEALPETNTDINNALSNDKDYAFLSTEDKDNNDVCRDKKDFMPISGRNKVKIIKRKGNKNTLSQTIEDKIHLGFRVNQEFDDDLYNNPKDECVIGDIVKYFFKKYQLEKGTDHPMISDEKCVELVEKFYFVPENMQDTELDFDLYKLMIDKYFATEYGKNSGFTINYQIMHFMNYKIRENLFYKVQDEYYDNVKSDYPVEI